MTHEDIEATKAPLMDHLIELRSRLIKALVGLRRHVRVLLLLRQADLQRPGVAVRAGWRAQRIRSSSTPALLEYFIIQLKLAMFGAAFISFPIVATQLYMFVAPGLYRNERQAFLPYLVATPVFFLLGALVVYFLVWPMLARFSLGMQQSPRRSQAEIELLPKVDDYLSLMMGLIFAFGIAFQLPVILTLLGPRRHRHLRPAQGQAALFHRRCFCDRGGAHAARRAQPAVARAAADVALRGLDLVGALGREEGGRGQGQGRRQRRRQAGRIMHVMRFAIRGVIARAGGRPGIHRPWHRARLFLNNRCSQWIACPAGGA